MSSADERIRLKEQIARMRGLLDGLQMALDMAAAVPLGYSVEAVADAGVRLVAVAARHDAYQRMETR